MIRLSVTVTVASQQLWKNRVSSSDVWMCVVPTQQWPSTQITLFQQTGQSKRLQAVPTPVDNERVNCCVLIHLFLMEFSNKSNRQKKTGNTFSDALLMPRFQSSRLTPIKKNNLASCNLITKSIAELIQGQTFWEDVCFAGYLRTQTHFLPVQTWKSESLTSHLLCIMHDAALFHIVPTYVG